MTEGATSSSQVPQEFSSGFAQRNDNPLIRPFTSLTHAAQTESSSSFSHFGRRIVPPHSRTKDTRGHSTPAGPAGPEGVRKPGQGRSRSCPREQVVQFGPLLLRPP